MNVLKNIKYLICIFYILTWHWHHKLHHRHHRLPLQNTHFYDVKCIKVRNMQSDTKMLPFDLNTDQQSNSLPSNLWNKCIAHFPPYRPNICHGHSDILPEKKIALQGFVQKIWTTLTECQEIAHRCYQTCSLFRISQVHTSHRPFHGSPLYSDTPRCRTARPGIDRCWSTSYP